MSIREFHGESVLRSRILTAILFAGSFICYPVFAGPDCSDPKHQDKPACTGGDGGGSPGGGEVLYDMDIGGDLSGSGTDWVLDVQLIKYLSDGRHATGGTGEIDLGFFVNSGAFTAPRAANCFGDGSGTSIQAAHLEQRNTGGAAAFIWFYAQTDDGAVTVHYRLELWGYFDDPSDWPPVSANTMNFPTWKLRLEGTDRKKYSNIACIGDGDFNTTTYIDVIKSG